MSFDSFGLHPSVMAGVRALGWSTPTPIQLQAIPPIMEGRDLIGLAQTGTGKTAAFLLPILHRLMQLPRGHVGAVIISPTRELAEQTCEAATALGRETGLRSVAIYGGIDMDTQVRHLSNGSEIAVACPGRLLDHLWHGTIDLAHLEILVIDEADRMLDMGFLPDIQSVLKCIMNPRQTLLFSATMPNDIRRLVKQIIHNPVIVQIGQTLPANTVSHALYPVNPSLKTSLLKAILRKNGMESVLVFTRTKLAAERVAEQLRRAGIRATSLQSNLSQYERQAALDGFKDGSYRVLVATDIASRGIDVLDISHVVNYDMPDSTDSYIHRIGRTGRIGKNGEAYTFVTNQDAGMVRSLEELLKAPLERRTLEGFDYGAPAPERDSGRFSRPLRGRGAPPRRS